MELTKNVGIRNRFDIEVYDTVTEETTHYQATNIVLDAMWSRLVNFQAYFVNIHYGTGTGSFASSRTSLFTHKGTRTATTHETVKALPTSRWVRRIVLNPEEEVGTVFTEVGVAFGSTNTNLVTHAAIADAEGNPITLTKTATQVLTIYATIYIELGAEMYGGKLKWMGMPNNNVLLNYLTGSSFPTVRWYVGPMPGVRSTGQPITTAEPLGNSGDITTANWVKDAANKKVTTPDPSAVGGPRIGTAAGNGHVAELGLGSANTSPVFSAVLPISGVFAGQTVTGVTVGVGDGEVTKFTLPARNIDISTIAAKVEGTPTSVTSAQSAFLQAQTAPTTMPGNDVLTCAWHTIGTETYLAVGGFTTDATRFRWYKLTDGALVAQTAPTTMPGNRVLTCAWHTIGSDTYLAVGSYTTDATKFTWYKALLNVSEIAFATAPTGTITADYTVLGMHKTTSYVIDLQCSIQYGEPT